jgi:hypothetical protein
MDNQAFLSGTDNDDDNFAALDSMVPHSFNNYGQQNHAPSQMNAVVPHSLYNNPSNPGATSFGSSDSDSGRVADGREQGFSGVSESLFDRIRARTAEQQKQSSQSSQPLPSSVQQTAFQTFPQQQHSNPTMELEEDPNATKSHHSFDAAIAGAASGVEQPPPNETTYSFSGAADFSSAVPRVPTYGPSRNAHYISANSSQQPYPSSLQDKASMALNATTETMKSLWAGAHTLVASAQSRMGQGGDGVSGGGYNTNFLLREEGLEGGVGAGRAHALSGELPAMNEAAGGGTLSAVSGQAYSMLSYGKTFCEDMYAFFMQLPNWGKGIVLVVLVLFIKFLFI